MATRRRFSVLLAVLSVLAIAMAGAPAQAAAGDIVTVTGTLTDSQGAPLAAFDLVVNSESGAQAVSTGDDGVYSVDLTLAAEQTWVSVSPASWLSGVTCEPGTITSGPAVVTINCAIPNYVYVAVSGVGHTDNGTSPEGQMVTLSSVDNWYIGGGVMAADGSFSFTAQMRDTVTEFYVSAPDGTRVGPFFSPCQLGCGARPARAMTVGAMSIVETVSLIRRGVQPLSRPAAVRPAWTISGT
jgi:hypothetical protein